jgi:hypothetical protein
MAIASDILAVAQWQAVFDLDYARDGGSITGQRGGNVDLNASGKFGGCLDISDASPSYVLYSGAGIADAMISTGCISLWYKPWYSGTPATTQYPFYFTTGAGTNNRIYCVHNTAGNLIAYVSDSTGGVIATISAAWAPTSGIWYHLELNFDVAAGASRMFVNGVQHGSTDTNTGTRTGTMDSFAFGVSTTVQTSFLDEAILYDAVQHTAGFTPPSAALDLGRDIEINSVGSAPSVSHLSRDIDINWFLSPFFTSTGALLENPSFELADVREEAKPAHWTYYLESYLWDLSYYGAPYSFVESFEYSWSGNHNWESSLVVPTNLTQAIWASTLLGYEGYELEWSNNENFQDDIGTPTDSVYGLAGSSYEDYEQEWNNRHKEKDVRTVTDYPIVFSLGDCQTRANEIKSVYNAHRVDLTKHVLADTTNAITSPDATDLASLRTLCDELWTDCWAHFIDVTPTYHLSHDGFAQPQPTVTYHPTSDLSDCSSVLWFLAAYCNQHFDWQSSEVGSYNPVPFFKDIIGGAGDVAQIAWTAMFDGNLQERYEANWDSNDTSLASFGPGDTTDALFDIDGGGTFAAETYEEQITMNIILVTASGGTPIDLDPTTYSAVTFAGSVTGASVYEIQVLVENNPNWITLATINSGSSLPHVQALGLGRTKVRIYTTTYGTGTPSAKLQWTEV